MANYETSVWITNESINVQNNTSTLEVAIGFRRTDYPYYGWNGDGTACYWIGVNGVQTAWTYFSFNWNIPQNEWKTVATGTFTVPHNNDGTKTVFLEGQIYTGDSVKPGYMPYYSGYSTLTTIPRGAEITNAGNFSDIDSPTITYRNPANADIEACISYDGHNDDVKYRPISKTSGSYTFNFTKPEREKLRQDCSNSNSKKLYFYIRTYLGGSYLYSSKAVTFSIVDANPEISYTIKDTNPKTVALTGDSSVVVNGVSNLDVSMTANGKKYATVSNNNKKIYYNDKWHTTTSATITGANSKNIKLWAQDSRGNTSEINITPSTINYYPPTCVMKLDNASVDGTAKFTISGDYYNGGFGHKNNTIGLQYLIREVSASRSSSVGVWVSVPQSDIKFTKNGYTANISVSGLDYHKTYDAQAHVSDQLFEKDSSNNRFSVKPVFDWGKTDFNVNGELRLNGKNIFDIILDKMWPVGSIYTSTKPTNPSALFGGSWEQFARGRTLVGVDAGDADFKPAEHTGGEKKHTLSTTEMPAHSHEVINRWSGVQLGYYYTNANKGSEWGFPSQATDSEHDGLIDAKSVGGGAAHNNLQPYITVYFWKRTA